MELREFAGRVLFATTLEQKLQCPDSITDEQPGSPLVTPAAPGRPAELRFKTSGTARDSFPGTRHLEQPGARGRLLHFFANHELLATELMALVLLKFPDAPAAFRKGVLQTLRDEQEHTRLYLARMRTCGIHFGELPVSGYFWRCVAPMENPIDYVAGLCLTFEQANLDFARHFARSFADVGDAETSRLLEKIYRDEIGHVAYGLKWFRRWKHPGESDWDAFCRTLKFPLSPGRAKGITLNVEGRRAAGFEPQFIAELDVYAQSKGRTPNVFVFNPFAEGRMAQGKAFNPTKHQAQLARDLTNLPQFLCRQDDLVLVERRPGVEFLSGLKQAGFTLPEFVEFDWSAGLRTGAITQRKLGGLRPWAWGPDSVEFLAPLFANLTGKARTADRCFNPNLARLYGKSWSAELLGRLLKSRAGRGGERWLCAENEAGVAVNSLDAALAAIAAIRARGHHKIIVKESLGLAGSNAMRLFEPQLLETQRRWIANAVARGSQLVVEPWLEREVDFSVQLDMTPEGLKVRGNTGLITDAKGQFQANWTAPNYERRIPARVVECFHNRAEMAKRLQLLYADIFSLLEEELRRAGYLGPLGIDAFVYRTASGECRLKPIVEINPRYTMGRVLVELMRQTCQGSFGWFGLVNQRIARAEGCDDFVSYAHKLRERFPLRLEDKPSPQIREGAICLNDPREAQVCLAVFRVARTLDPLIGPRDGQPGAEAP